jgi:hypothetical protein
MSQALAWMVFDQMSLNARASAGLGLPGTLAEIPACARQITSLAKIWKTR